MENKILVADDSPTIQKVISITLANKDYVLESAHSEDELLDKLEGNSYNLVLLDYNLSDTATGNDLSREIRKRNADALIMAMLGTFDSVEDSELEDAGFSDKIVKPFESSKFIQKIENLLSSALDERSMDEDIFSNSESESDSQSEDTEDGFDSDEWSMDGPIVDKSEEEKASILDLKSEETGNSLQDEMAGWGMSVPEVIGEEALDDDLFPPSIEAQKVDIETEELNLSPNENEEKDESDYEFSINSESNASVDSELTQEIKIPEELQELSQSTSMESSEDESDNDEQSFPETNDLDYPSISNEVEVSTVADSEEEHQPQLTSLDELDVNEEDLEEDLDSTDPQIIIGTAEDSPDLLTSLSDDISPDDFWAADVDDESGPDDTNGEENKGDEDIELISLGEEEEESYDIAAHAPVENEPKKTELNDASRATLDALSNLNEIGPKLEKDEQEIGPKLEKDEQEIGPKLERVDTDSLAQRIKTELLNELKPLIKEMVKEALEEANSDAAEKVAWEVIPDLAENLIRKEVQEISKKVLNKHSLN